MNLAFPLAILELFVNQNNSRKQNKYAKTGKNGLFLGVFWRLNIFLLFFIMGGFGALLAPVGNSPMGAFAADLSAIRPLIKGDMATFILHKTPKPVPKISFIDGAEKSKTLEDWRGKVVLLNLWATWCAPCRKEMPALDQLQSDLGSDNFEVVALSIDRGGLKKPKAFLEKIKVKTLALYNDPTAKANFTLRAIGMPTTLLLNPDGQEIGRLVGPAEWHSAEAVALLKAAIAHYK